MLPLVLAAPIFAADWKNTIEAVKPAIVSIRVSAVRAFDTESARFSYATGFVVDAERGIILTNRHVVKPGPVIAEAVLENNEEITLTPLYRDPVHDFGFFSFDPEDVRFMEVVSLPLSPGAIDVGDEIRVIGNDAGEKGSVLSGTIARLDRDAPSYGRNKYNDFNTFYIQSSSGTSGGSSGSPVVDIAGDVLALNAGSRRSAATSYFLPLDRVVRALTLLQAEQPISRGTLQSTLTYRPYDEVRRRGLRPETEAEIRATFPEATGMLVLDEILPLGPADGILRPGDILVRLDGAPLTSFVALESALDDAVGGALEVEVERNGAPLLLTVTVGDLHAITPQSYLEWGGSVFNPLSYQVARTNGIPVQGVILTSRGYAMSAAGVYEDSIITHIDGEPVPDLRALEAALAARPDGVDIVVRSFHISNPRRENVDVVRSERRWFPMQHCEREAARWTCTPSAAPPAAPAPEVAQTTWPEVPDRVARKVARSLVVVDFDIPFRTDGAHGALFKGAGLVVDAVEGLVAVDRDTVPTLMGDVTITFAGSVAIPGKAVWVHPEHNLALVRYDPALIGDTPVQSARLDTTPLAVGDPIWQVGLSSSSLVVQRKTSVDRIRPVGLGLPKTPAFRDTNLDLIYLQDSASSIGGVLVDRSGSVRALWASFVDLSGETSAYLRGLAVEHLDEALHSYRSGQAWHGLGAELVRRSLVEARERGLPPGDVALIEAHDDQRQVLEIHRLMAGSPAAEYLREGDLILRADGETVTTPREIELAVRGDSVTLEVLRDAVVSSVTLPTTILPTTSTTRLIGFAGAMLQPTPIWLAMQRGHPAEGVYVSWYWYGSPAAQFGLNATRRITAIDGEEIADLDALLAAVADKADRETAELTTELLDGRTEVLTLRLDLTHWPTFEIRQTEDGWERRAL